MLTLDLPDLAATEALGRRLAALLGPGDVVALVGTLGAGKTHLARAIAAGLGVAERLVTSPTFVLIQEYHGRLPVYHFDVYRLADPAAFLDLGAAEYLDGDGVCLIEWADRVAEWLPERTLWVRLGQTGPTGRRALLRGPQAALLSPSASGASGDEMTTSAPPS